MKYIYRNMIMRCHNPKHRQYPDYGARGIVVCDRWRESFDAFVSDIGPRPSALHSIDRRNNDGPYSPDNVRWATKKEQARNTRRTRYVVIDGVCMTLAECCENHGVRISVASDRIRDGWDAARAATQPVRGKKNDGSSPTCKRGHLKSGDNLFMDASGWPACRTCRRDSQRKWHENKRQHIGVLSK